MTVPWQHNCPHQGSGWCLDCLRPLAEQLQAQEAELERLRGKVKVYGSMAADANATLGGVGQNERLRDAAKRVVAERDALLELAAAYEKWEADVIMSQEAWRGGAAELPTLTAELWDRLLEIQAMRNAVLAQARAAGVTPEAKP